MHREQANVCRQRVCWTFESFHLMTLNFSKNKQANKQTKKSSLFVHFALVKTIVQSRCILVLPINLKGQRL